MRQVDAQRDDAALIMGSDGWGHIQRRSDAEGAVVDGELSAQNAESPGVLSVHLMHEDRRRAWERLGPTPVKVVCVEVSQKDAAQLVLVDAHVLEVIANPSRRQPEVDQIKIFRPRSANPQDGGIPARARREHAK